MQNEIAYSRPVTLTNILRFAVPTIAMSVFMSFYTMVDGLFVSNLIGTSALSALNLVYPVIALVTAISTMLATGGSAAIMRKMGEGKPDEAKQDFTFLILVNVLTGLVMCGLGYLFMGEDLRLHVPVPGGLRLLLGISEPLPAVHRPYSSDE